MDALQASNTIKNILEDTNRIKNAPLCTLVDGNWGIGKTQLIKNYFDQEVNYELIYVSVFGKISVKEIEKTLLINLIPGFKEIKDFGGFSKVFGNFFKDIFGKFTGFNIENYINSFSIEDMKNIKKEGKRKIIICFDDLERKSDSIIMKELLGLIERTSINFDVLLIANTNEFKEDDLNLFNSYKEKVIDNFIKVDRLNKSILNQILNEEDELNTNEIIDIYFENKISFGLSPSTHKAYLAENIYNLRIFKKYFELILRTKAHVGVENINTELLRICKAVVYDYYYPIRSKENNQLNFDQFNIYNDLKKLLLFEKISDDSFKSYKNKFSKIRQDINTLYNGLYHLNDTELDILINKIDEKIMKDEWAYFIDQSSIISLVSALEENNLLNKKRYKELLRIAIEIYEPKENLIYNPFKHTSWNSVDTFGNEIECHKNIKVFIEELNSNCIDKYSNFMNKIINDCIKSEDYDRLLELKFEIDALSQFKIIFDYYFNKLVNEYSNKSEEKIKVLINLTKSEIISNFFEERISTENSLTNKMKYQFFNNYLDEKMYLENQEDSYIDYLED